MTSWVEGIKAPLPPDLVVSHKFGERTEMAGGSVAWRELHDCGIVYYPYEPYFLCVMTKGQDFDDQRAVLRGISAVVYRAKH
jgi:hypothetical protein